MPSNQRFEAEISQNSPTASANGFMDKWGHDIANLSSGAFLSTGSYNMAIALAKGEYVFAAVFGITTAIVAFGTVGHNIAHREGQQRIKQR